MVKKRFIDNYNQISLPSELINEIENTLEEHKELGFTSANEFIKSAIRDKLSTLKREDDDKK